MSYTIEQVNGCTKKLIFNYEQVDLSSQIESALKEKQKTANLKGFRKGKAPLGMIQKLYGPQVENDALYQFISKEYFDAIEKEGIRAVGYPQFSNTKYESGNTVSFEATVEIFPEVKDITTSGIEVKKVDATVEDKEVEDIKKNYLGSKAEMRPIENASLENGHFATINFQGVKEDGERPDNMKADEYQIEVGSNTFIPGFEEGLVGMKAGEKKEIKVTFPENYHETSLQNAPVTFEVELLDIKEKHLPELTDDLAKEFGFESASDFEAKNKERLEFQKQRQAKEQMHQELLEKLIEKNNFDIPTALIAQQEKALKDDLTNNLKQQGFNDSMVDEYFNKWKDDLRNKAIFQVKSGLILDNLAKKYDVKSEESDLDKKFEEMSAQAGITVEEVKSYYGQNDQIKQNLMYAIREEKTFEKIFDDVKLV